LGGAALARLDAARLSAMRGLFVTGTDTGAGKSIVAAAICAALAERGERVAAFKPVVTGLAEPEGRFPPDHELLARAAGGDQSAAEVAPYSYDPPLSPHLAAELAGETIEPARLVATARGLSAGADVLIAEGVGGLLVPITTGYLIRDLARDLGMPVVVAARTGLGTINHSLLTVEAARAVGLEVVGIVMTPWPAEPAAIEHSNRAAGGRAGERAGTRRARHARGAGFRAAARQLALSSVGWRPRRAPPAPTRTSRRSSSSSCASARSATSSATSSSAPRSSSSAC
jgi:dethiobiotin synthetase